MDIAVAAFDMGVLLQRAGCVALVAVGMLRHSAEGLAGHTDAGQLQAPENHQYHHEGKADNDLSESMAVRIHLFKI